MPPLTFWTITFSLNILKAHNIRGVGLDTSLITLRPQYANISLVRSLKSTLNGLNKVLSCYYMWQNSLTKKLGRKRVHFHVWNDLEVTEQ